jgi:hypothetical protein
MILFLFHILVFSLFRFKMAILCHPSQASGFIIQYYLCIREYYYFGLFLTVRIQFCPFAIPHFFSTTLFCVTPYRFRNLLQKGFLEYINRMAVRFGLVPESLDIDLTQKVMDVVCFFRSVPRFIHELHMNTLARFKRSLFW